MNFSSSAKLTHRAFEGPFHVRLESAPLPSHVVLELARHGVKLGAKHYLVERIGLPEILGMLRVRGLHGVLRRLKAEVTRAAIDQSAVSAPVSQSPAS